MEVKVTLAGAEYTVHELPLRKNKEWRAKALEGPNKALSAMDVKPGESVTATEMFNRFSAVMQDHIEEILALVLDYLRLEGEEREKIEEGVTENEVIRAYMAINRVAFHADFFLELAGVSLRVGLAAPVTTTNSPEASGDSG